MSNNDEIKCLNNIAELINCDNIICNDTVNTIMSAEDYDKLSLQARSHAFDSMREYSEPKYKCPKCDDGGMCRNETVVLCSNPPQYKYKCNKCGHIESKYI